VLPADGAVCHCPTSPIHVCVHVLITFPLHVRPPSRFPSCTCTSTPDYSEEPVPRRLHCCPGPNKRGDQALVRVHAGAAAGLARDVRGVPERPDRARACRRSNTSYGMVPSPIADSFEHKQLCGTILDSVAGSAGPSSDVVAFFGGSSEQCGRRTVGLFRVRASARGGVCWKPRVRGLAERASTPRAGRQMADRGRESGSVAVHSAASDFPG